MLFLNGWPRHCIIIGLFKKLIAANAELQVNA
jgi:hypothetical protein